MATTSPLQGIRIPQETDTPDPPRDFANAIGDTEKLVVQVYNSVSDRSTKVTAPTEGMLSYQKDTNTFTYYTGSAWVNLLPTVPNFTSGTSVPSSGTGANGDVFFKIG